MERVLIFLIFLLPFCFTFQLQNDPNNACVAHGNGSTYDISKLFDWPVTIQDEKTGYTYWVDLCSGYKCPGGLGGLTPVCQHADMYYACGKSSNAVWLIRGDVPTGWWTILYPSGAQFRSTQISFIPDPSVDPPTIKFTGEEPYEFYNFEIRGKCIGSPYADGCSKTVIQSLSLIHI
eukprot:TRINITY_DN830_c0_g1_i1.p1 TRINITY_DN830_c0_g1~~TRINITY_DN830_c0_g1_i1.p1  ORF type:complete len:177 (-),score=29.08 TRINITY_DN830_c0_g1_i1:25-555(-)